MIVLRAGGRLVGEIKWVVVENGRETDMRFLWNHVTKEIYCLGQHI